MAQWAGSGSEWRREFIGAALVGLFLGGVGPFGTYLNRPVFLRFVYWEGTTLLSLVVYGLGVRWALHVGERRRWPVWLTLPLSVMVISIPMSLAIALTATTVWPGIGRFVQPFEWFAQVVFMSLAWNIPVHFLRRHPPWSAQRPPPPSDFTSGRVGGLGADRFMNRLPPRLGRELLALQMEDHYVRAHTAHGSDLVLIPLRQAVEELSDVEGLRVHRSWWVARSAVAGARWEGRNLRLRLTSGLEAPVARSSVAELRAAGWSLPEAATD